jgi:hypothetical protein
MGSSLPSLFPSPLFSGVTMSPQYCADLEATLQRGVEELKSLVEVAESRGVSVAVCVDALRRLREVAERVWRRVRGEEWLVDECSSEKPGIKPLLGELTELYSRGLRVLEEHYCVRGIDECVEREYQRLLAVAMSAPGRARSGIAVSDIKKAVLALALNNCNLPGLGWLVELNTRTFTRIMSRIPELRREYRVVERRRALEKLIDVIAPDVRGLIRDSEAFKKLYEKTRELASRLRDADLSKLPMLRAVAGALYYIAQERVPELLPKNLWLSQKALMSVLDISEPTLRKYVRTLRDVLSGR